ncbi:MAG: hypothetical protein HKN34_00850, partial [Gammaproteobacteria bacterium]|nr:hypothetical protein [Gammaproteobacteria bacterium]
MKKFLQYSIVLISSVLFTVSCGGGGGGGSDTPSGNSNPTADQLKASIRQFSDITDAQGFVLTGDNPASARPALTSAQMRTANLDVNLDPNSLYKVKPDGTLERVVIVDDSSEEITRGLIQPATVRDIDQNFMIMYFTIRDESE